MSSLLLNFDLPPVDPSTSSMTDDVKPAVLSVAQFRAQLERQMSDIENHLIFELRACEGKQSAVAARARLEGFYAMKGEVVAGYAEARQASAWQPEICICAAVTTREGRIFRGHRHGDALQAAGKNGCHPSSLATTQGFITSRNRFVDREEGARLQREAGIVSAHTGQFTDFLFSEDLYLGDKDSVVISLAPPVLEDDAHE